MELKALHYAQPLGKWSDGDGYFLEEEAVIEMLAAGVLFVSATDCEGSATLMVNCNDLFDYATGDAEPVGFDELRGLYEAFLTDYGVSIWACKHRGLRPLLPIEARWRDLDLWDQELEALPSNRRVEE